jgi:3'-phosphoadenosine 5'-phosphosulfate sulfotransferase (PAPS reductase)/FAD synthetase
MERSKVLTVISLGVGVQSSTMALMSAKGVLPKVDCAIFADTGYEPKKVYEYLEWIKTQLPFPVYTVMKGNIKDDMLNSISNGTRFLVAPFYTKNSITGKKGMVMRQCTNYYNIQPNYYLYQ